ncbi:MAG: hypothetical protein MUE32_04475 [Bacteroidales bacterium]|jgi:hypothetical protein|nr:hypothetical protein [Bacteroidales bacterium]
MKQNSNFRYSGISSFRDLQTERNRLDLKGKLAEAKIRMNLYRIKEVFSLSKIVPSLISDLGMPRLSEIIEMLINSKKTDI